MSGWRPILDGELAAEAKQTIRDIAQALARGEGAPPKLTDSTLFWAYIASAIEEDWVQRAYDDTCEALLAKVEAGFGNDVSLFHGASGAGFVMAHVAEPDTVDTALAMIDHAIAERLALPWVGPYDLIDGLVGIGVYLLERVQHSTAARAGLARVVHHLALAAEIDAVGATWRTPPAHVSDEHRAACPEGYYDCGIAHGVPGVVAFLGRMAARHDETARSLADLGYDWLLARALPPGGRGRYPSWIAPGAAPFPTRTAWCYGDPGVAIALWHAAHPLGRPVDISVELARASAARAVDLGTVRDAGLCHGAAGLAHIYNRCYQASGDDTFAEAARMWFVRALAMRRPEGVGGFLAWLREGVWEPSTTLLEGAAGIGLALLAAIEPVEPAWDRMLLCDLPVR